MLWLFLANCRKYTLVLSQKCVITHFAAKHKPDDDKVPYSNAPEKQMLQQGQRTSPVPQHPGVVSPPSTCPDGSTFCSDDVCSIATCPRVPTAVCRVNKCDKPFQAKWFMVLPPPPYPASSLSTFPEVEVTGICFGREFAWLVLHSLAQYTWYLRIYTGANI